MSVGGKEEGGRCMPGYKHGWIFNDYNIILKEYLNTVEHSRCVGSIGLIFKFKYAIPPRHQFFYSFTNRGLFLRKVYANLFATGYEVKTWSG